MDKDLFDLILGGLCTTILTCLFLVAFSWPWICEYIIERKYKTDHTEHDEKLKTKIPNKKSKVKREYNF